MSKLSRRKGLGSIESAGETSSSEPCFLLDDNGNLPSEVFETSVFNALRIIAKTVVLGMAGIVVMVGLDNGWMMDG